jgi:uncharacterized protein (TIGR03086 family)
MDMINVYAEAIQRNQKRVENLRADQLDDPTPCTEWTVQALLDHIIGGYRMFAAALGAPVPESANDPAEAHRAAGDAAVRAFGAPDAMQRSLVLLPVGEVPGEVALGLALTDAVVHGWDLAKATGQDTTIDESLAAMLLVGLEQSVTADMRQPAGGMPVFAPPVPVDANRPAGDRLVAFLGRQP